MQATSELYKEITEKNNHRFETKLLIGDEFFLINEDADKIIFGSDRIYYDSDAGGFSENMLIAVKTSKKLFAEDKPQVGCCISAEIDVEMRTPAAEIPRMSSLRPQIRATDGINHSEWLSKGVFYIDTRAENKAAGRLSLHGYDAILKAEQDYIAQGDVGQWPKTDIEVVREIAEIIEVEIDDRTTEIMTRAYLIQLPVGYSCREMLGYIAAMYCGNFIMSEEGKLRLVRLNEIGVESSYLVDGFGDALTFGGDRLIV